MTDDEAILELGKYLVLEGSELSEACELLVSLANYSYIYADNFNDAVMDETRKQLLNFKDNTEIVNKEVTKTYTNRVLEWKSE